MAISPDVFKQDAVKLLDEAEKWVDKMLTQYSNVGRTTISTGVPPGFPYGLMEKLLDRYRAVGWRKVHFHSDQRDGDCIIFEI